MSIKKQGPFLPTSGFTIVSGVLGTNTNFNWISTTQPSISPPDYPTSILTQTAPNGSYSPYAYHIMSGAYSSTDMLGVCGFNFQVPSFATVSGIEVVIDGATSGQSISIEGIYVVTSGRNLGLNLPITPIRGAVDNIIPDDVNITSVIWEVDPTVSKMSGIYGGIGHLGGLERHLRPDDSVSGVNNYEFGVAVCYSTSPPAIPTYIYLDSIKVSLYYDHPPLIQQGPLGPASGHTFTSGLFSSSNNWISTSQPSISPPVWPTAIYVQDGPGIAAHARHALTLTVGSSVYTDMFAVCKFGFNIPSDAVIRGADVNLVGTYSGQTSHVGFGAMYLTVSGAGVSGYSAPEGVPSIGLSTLMLSPGPSAIPFGNPDTTGYLHKFGTSGTLWGLESYLTPDGGVSGVNNPCFGVAFGVQARPTGMVGGAVTIYIDSVQMNLYYTYNYATSGIPLYINGAGSDSGIPLYIDGYSTYPSSIPLFVHGHQSVPSAIPLYISNHSGSDSGTLPLSILGPSGGISSGNIPLFIYSTTNSGTLDGIDLYIHGAAQTGYLPLFLHANINPTGHLPLVISGAVVSVNSDIPLFLQNNSYVSGLQLYVEGKQITINPGLGSNPSGWIPSTGVMSLFISRPEYGIIPLYICGHGRVSGEIPLYINSNLTSTGTIPLYTYGKSSGIHGIYLFTHGAHH